MDPIVICRDLVNYSRLYKAASTDADRLLWRDQYAKQMVVLGRLAESKNEDIVFAYQIACTGLELMSNVKGIPTCQFVGV